MEKISALELVAVGAPVTIYWFYTLFLMLTDASPHKGIQISTRHKIVTTSTILLPLALLWSLGAFNATEATLQMNQGILYPAVNYLMFVWLLCTPIAAFYALILLIRQYNAWTPDPVAPKYKINSTEDSILAMNAATGFMRDRKFDEEQEQHERHFEDAQRRSEIEAIARRLAADEAEGIFT
jgi:hypothetical protein